MKRKQYVIFVFVLLAASFCWVQELEKEKSVEWTAVLEEFPAHDAAHRDRLAVRLLTFGEEIIENLCAMMVSPEKGGDEKVRYALKALTDYVCRPGGEKERKDFVGAVARALQRGLDREAKVFLMARLQLAGKDESVPSLSRFLSDPYLCDPAARALAVIGTPDAEEALLKSLGSAERKVRLPIIQALGRMRSRKAVEKIMVSAGNFDSEERIAVLRALAEIGDARAASVFEKVSVTAPFRERALAPIILLDYAQRLAENGEVETCLQICREITAHYTASQENALRCRALSIIAEVAGDRALPDILSASESENRAFRKKALTLARTKGGKEAARLWLDKAMEAPAHIRADIIAMLGQKGETSILDDIRGFLKDEDESVRCAAVPALFRLGGEKILKDLMVQLDTAGEKERMVLEETLLLFSAGLLVPEIVAVFDGARPGAKAVLLRLLSTRGAREQLHLFYRSAEEKNPDIRRAALDGLETLVSAEDLPRCMTLLRRAEDVQETVLARKAAVAAALDLDNVEARTEPFLNALNEAEEKKKSRYLPALARLGGPAALTSVIKLVQTSDEDLREEALRALGDWRDPDAADKLFSILMDSEAMSHRIPILKGFIRLVHDGPFSEEEKLDWYRKALETAMDDDEKKVILSGLSGIKNQAALEIAAEFLRDPELCEEAAWAVLSVALPPAGPESGLSGTRTIAVLKQAARIVPSPYDRERVQRYVEEELEREGFFLLFNGRDLSGWKGLVGNPVSRAAMSAEELQEAQKKADESMRDHWKVMGETLIFDAKGQSLCTKKDYTDFEMFIDWKIEENGDSGIYLRGSPQVQVWDPAQWPEGSGGLYNNKSGPSKPLAAADNPVGEWNTFFIRMKGERVTVLLNGVLVVDNVVLENYWERDKPIYPCGQIELQSHNTPLYFRSIYIRPIISEDGGGF
ncbi:MAG: DUF1080 domain-containing protein [Candidatus Aminicenantes bacterium]|nr:DUF1080 domain-containing protein [Candidatus Aminicenantes bacterium]